MALTRSLVRRTASLLRVVSRTPATLAHYAVGSVFVIHQVTALGLRERWGPPSLRRPE